jgi:hypothetical protein
LKKTHPLYLHIIPDSGKVARIVQRIPVPRLA